MKQILIAVAILSSLMTVSAQQYNEVDLLGTWKVTSQTGDISNTVKSFEKIFFGETLYDTYDYDTYTKKWHYNKTLDTPTGVVYNINVLVYDYSNGSDVKSFSISPTRELTDYLITNDNKLHLQFSDYERYYMRFVIKRMTNEEMVLENYAGTCELTLKKEDVGRVADRKLDAEGATEYYSINGVKVANPDKGIFVEKNGRESHLIAK